MIGTIRSVVSLFMNKFRKLRYIGIQQENWKSENHFEHCMHDKSEIGGGYFDCAKA
jgi:hypothetical protein